MIDQSKTIFGQMPKSAATNSIEVVSPKARSANSIASIEPLSPDRAADPILKQACRALFLLGGILFSIVLGMVVSLWAGSYHACLPAMLPAITITVAVYRRMLPKQLATTKQDRG